MILAGPELGGSPGGIGGAGGGVRSTRVPDQAVGAAPNDVRDESGPGPVEGTAGAT